MKESRLDISDERWFVNAFEVGCVDPRIELRWPALPLDENFLLPFVCCSLPDHLLDEEPILCDFFHLFWVPWTFELLTPSVDQIKYPSWGGLVALDQKVLLAAVGDVTLVERTFHFADPDHVPSSLRTSWVGVPCHHPHRAAPRSPSRPSSAPDLAIDQSSGGRCICRSRESSRACRGSSVSDVQWSRSRCASWASGWNAPRPPLFDRCSRRNCAPLLASGIHPRPCSEILCTRLTEVVPVSWGLLLEELLEGGEHLLPHALDRDRPCSIA